MESKVLDKLDTVLAEAVSKLDALATEHGSEAIRLAGVVKQADAWAALTRGPVITFFFAVLAYAALRIYRKVKIQGLANLARHNEGKNEYLKSSTMLTDDEFRCGILAVVTGILAACAALVALITLVELATPSNWLAALDWRYAMARSLLK